jgi:hypothetical protein
MIEAEKDRDIQWRPAVFAFARRLRSRKTLSDLSLVAI